MDLSTLMIFGGIVLAGIAVIYGVVAAKRSVTASSSKISVEKDCVRGKGFVTAIGVDAYDTIKNVPFSNFQLTYDQIAATSVTGNWLTIVAAGSQYAVRTPNAASLATEIQKNMENNKA